MTYITEVEEALKDLRRRTVNGELPLEQRIEEVRKVADRYALKHAALNDTLRAVERANAEAQGREPRELPFNPLDADILTQLADLLLHEDLTDATAWKSRQSEYPFLSEIQLARRRDGIHQRKNEGGSGETKMEQAESIGTDGRDYRVPKRRERSINDNLLIDEAARSRNTERRRKYDEFTAVQPVVTYKMT